MTSRPLSEVPTGLWPELDVYRRRYDMDEYLEPLRRLGQSLDRRYKRAAVVENRLEELRRQLGEAEAELATVAAEISGSRRGADLLVEDILDRVRRDHSEAWSPTPVLGFRLWIIRDGLYGARLRWDEPTLTAQCLKGFPYDDVPHGLRWCGPPGCGIYATKDLHTVHRALEIPFGEGVAVGLVALTGKVIEHTLGYRAKTATVVALAARHQGRCLETDEWEVISGLFTDPGHAMASWGKSADELGKAAQDDYLHQQKERYDTWTWAERSA